jgi:hypothetical protein
MLDVAVVNTWRACQTANKEDNVIVGCLEEDSISIF